MVHALPLETVHKHPSLWPIRVAIGGKDPLLRLNVPRRLQCNDTTLLTHMYESSIRTQLALAIVGESGSVSFGTKWGGTRRKNRVPPPRKNRARTVLSIVV